MLIDDLEAAEVSFMPIGRAPGNDRGPMDFGGERFSKRQSAKDWHFKQWNASWGIQVYTGIPSERDGAPWHDLDFTYQAICAAPDAILRCIEALVNAVANPLLTLSKSGGLRFSCRVPDYLHPNTDQGRLYVYKHTPTPGNPHHRDVYLEIFGEAGYTPWDARCEILLGNLLDPPVIAKEVLFAPLNALRSTLHEPTPLGEEAQQRSFAVVPPSLGSSNLDLAGEAFIRRGFSYLRQEDGSHHWTPLGSESGDVDVSLWQADGTVWVRASAPEVGLPTRATPLTDVWDDTGIVPSVPATGLPVTDKMLAVREGTLSPLAIRRRPLVLPQQERNEQDAVQGQPVFNGTARILGLISGTNIGNNYEIASHLRNSGTTCLNVPTEKLATEAEQRLENRDRPSFVRWKTRMHLWEQVKDIPVEARMATPFQRGNVCEDPERCDALEKKGGNPRESICPQCPVYTVCQERGYLSQPAALQRAKAQISAIPQLFFDPQHAAVVSEMLGELDETEQFCIIDEVKPHELFGKCKLSKNILETWGVDWQGSALGNFAKALLNALEIKSRSHSDAVRRVRMAIQAFEWQEEELIRQMCQINVPGSAVARGTVDAESGQELAYFTIAFEGGASAYIPLDNNTADILMAKGLPVFQPHSFVLNESMKIPMSMAEAIQLGILNTETVENIQGFPTVCRDPSQTYWHQLKRFFAYYTRDADAPLQWNTKDLYFKVPPVLHEQIKHLLVMCVTLPERHLRRAFPNEEIEIARTEPTAWVEGNQVFQVRTGIYPQETILDFENNWAGMGTSKAGQRFLVGIRAEIERDPGVKHAIVTYKALVPQLEDVAEKENVYFVTDFQKAEKLKVTFEAAEVIWVVGKPEPLQRFVWLHAQMLFGNDEQPLSYERNTGSYRYEDERVQSVYEDGVIRILTQTLGLIQLDRLSNKTVVLITGMPLPDVTDRPETFLFDWEDFEIAGGLDKLAEVIATRQRFETEKANITAESSREEVERILGCSRVHANRILYNLRGGRIRPVPIREQILSLLVPNAEKKAAELVGAIDGHPKAIDNELRRLVGAGEIVRVRWAVYALREKK